METRYADARIKKLCKSLDTAKKKYNNEIAISLHGAINLLENAENLNDIRKFKKYRLHPLENKKHDDRRGQFSITLANSAYRLILYPIDENGEKWNGENESVGNIYLITNIVEIMEVVNYHD